MLLLQGVSLSPVGADSAFVSDMERPLLSLLSWPWVSGEVVYFCERKGRCTKRWLLQVAPMSFPVAALLHTHRSSLSLCQCFVGCQHFFALCLHRIRARAPCLLSKLLLLEKQDIWLMANYCRVTCLQPKQHEVCLVSWSSVQHTRSVGQNTNLVLFPLSHLAGEISPSNTTECWRRVISVFCQVSTGHISL